MISSYTLNGSYADTPAFQSRNRGSFDFKANLVGRAWGNIMFQSRNRGSFDFKRAIAFEHGLEFGSFNLVIEVLLISRIIGATQHVGGS